MSLTPFSIAYWLTAAISKSGYACVNENTSPLKNQSPSQPIFQPSTSTPSKPCLAAKSMYRLASSVVAPWLSPLPQVFAFICIAHQIPTYLPGLTQSTSPSTFGSFRLRINGLFNKPMAESAIWMVRQGVTIGSVVLTNAPSLQGARSALKVPVRSCLRDIAE